MSNDGKAPDLQHHKEMKTEGAEGPVMTRKEPGIPEKLSATVPLMLMCDEEARHLRTWRQRGGIRTTLFSACRLGSLASVRHT